MSAFLLHKKGHLLSAPIFLELILGYLVLLISNIVCGFAVFGSIQRLTRITWIHNAN